MKKIVFLVFTAFLLSSCTKEKSWAITDCLGNDITSYQGTENDVKAYCQTNSTPSCTWTYRKL